jgi:CheY-like chemotaxis protein
MCTFGYRAPVDDTPLLPEHAALAQYRVLLVEDDPEYGRMVERVLRRARPPLWVHREERLAAGLDCLEHDHYDALVMDLKLPDAEGRSTLENACAQANQLPVVVLTSTDDEALALDAIRGGAEDYLVKQRARPRRRDGTRGTRGNLAAPGRRGRPGDPARECFGRLGGRRLL